MNLSRSLTARSLVVGSAVAFTAIALVTAAGEIFVPLQALAAPAKAGAAPAAGPAAVKSTGLRRFDFRLEGASCARCIINVRSALRATKGVQRCEISLRKPYGGVVAYDAGATNVSALTNIILKADPKTEVAVKDGVDETMAKLPIVLIPKYTSLDKASN